MKLVMQDSTYHYLFGSLTKGDTVDLPDDYARHLVGQGLAVAAPKDDDHPVTPHPAPQGFSPEQMVALDGPPVPAEDAPKPAVTRGSAPKGKRG